MDCFLIWIKRRSLSLLQCRAHPEPMSRAGGEAGRGEETDCGLRDATFLSAMETSTNTPFALSP
jgi:hypothetical protein